MFANDSLICYLDKKWFSAVDVTFTGWVDGWAALSWREGVIGRGFVADLVFGPRGTDAIFASPMYSATGNIVNQLYAYWNVSESVTLTFGNFNTFLGYEVISPVANFNYSTSYLFSYGPFSHTGLKADFALSDDFSLMLGVFNDTDLTEFNPTGDYAAGAQLGYKDQYLNLLYDPSFFEIDFTGAIIVCYYKVNLIQLLIKFYIARVFLVQYH